MGEDGSDSLIELLNKSNNRQKEDVLTFVEEKFERRLAEEFSKVTKEISKVHEKITQEIGKVNVTIGKINERITQEIGKVNEKITQKIGKVNEKITQEIGKTNEKIAQVHVKIEATKSDIIKWMFIFWLGQVTVILGILFVFFKKTT